MSSCVVWIIPFIFSIIVPTPVHLSLGRPGGCWQWVLLRLCKAFVNQSLCGCLMDSLACLFGVVTLQTQGQVISTVSCGS